MKRYINVGLRHCQSFTFWPCAFEFGTPGASEASLCVMFAKKTRKKNKEGVCEECLLVTVGSWPELDQAPDSPPANKSRWTNQLAGRFSSNKKNGCVVAGGRARKNFEWASSHLILHLWRQKTLQVLSEGGGVGVWVPSAAIHGRKEDKTGILHDALNCLLSSNTPPPPPRFHPVLHQKTGKKSPIHFWCIFNARLFKLTAAHFHSCFRNNNAIESAFFSEGEKEVKCSRHLSLTFNVVQSYRVFLWLVLNLFDLHHRLTSLEFFAACFPPWQPPQLKLPLLLLFNSDDSAPPGTMIDVCFHIYLFGQAKGF